MSPMLRWWPGDEQYGDSGEEDLQGDGEQAVHREGVGAVQPNPHPIYHDLCFSKVSSLLLLSCAAFMRMEYGFPPLTEDGTEAQ